MTHVLVKVDALLHVHDQQRHLADRIPPVGRLANLEGVTVGVFDAHHLFHNLLSHGLVGDDARAQDNFLRYTTQDYGSTETLITCASHLPEDTHENMEPAAFCRDGFQGDCSRAYGRTFCSE